MRAGSTILTSTMPLRRTSNNAINQTHFPYVGQSDYAHFKIVARPSKAWDGFRLRLGRHAINATLFIVDRSQ